MSSDERHYETVAQELAGDSRRTGLWLRALTEADGDEKRAQAGYVKARVAELKAAEATERKQERENDPTRLRGVKGWLLLFCIWLTILGPLLTVLGLLGSWFDLRLRLGSYFEYVQSCFILDSLIVAGLACAGLRCGLDLWKPRSGAVEDTITYLRVKFGYSLARAGLRILVAIRLKGVVPPGQIYLPAVLLVGWEVAWLFVGLAYLRRSKRVRANFGKEVTGESPGWFADLTSWGRTNVGVMTVVWVIALAKGGSAPERNPSPGRIEVAPPPQASVGPTAYGEVTRPADQTPNPTPLFDLFAWLRQEADQAFDAGDYQEAISKYSEALRFSVSLRVTPILTNLDRVITHKKRGNAYRELKQYGPAFEDYNKAIESDPFYPDTYLERGIAYGKTKQPERALADFTNAIRLGHKNYLAYMNRGVVYGELGQPEQAVSDITIAIGLDPKSPFGYCNRGVVYYNGFKQPARAVEDYTQAIRLKPNYTNAYRGRGLAYSDLKQYGRALEDFSKLIELEPTNADAYNSRGIVYSNLNQLERAFSDYSKAIALDPKHVNAYNNRGLTYKAIGKQNDAMRDFAKATELTRTTR